jgi:CBS-domain-containing membrane protein
MSICMIERKRAIAIAAGAAGAAVAVAIMEIASTSAEFPLMAIPFATSIVLVMGSPDAEPAQPRALVGGHIVSTLIALAVFHVFGNGPWIAALSVALAIIGMHATRTFHPPAGIDPLVVAVNGMSWSFLLAPVGVGALLLATFAFAWHNLVGLGVEGRPLWPKRWW